MGRDETIPPLDRGDYQIPCISQNSEPNTENAHYVNL